MNREKLVQNIKAYCALRGVKPTVACRECGVGVSFINNIERGQTPSVAKVQMLAQYLGCTVSDLLGEAPSGSVKIVEPKISSLNEEFARLFVALTPEDKNTIIAEMLKRQRKK